MLTRLESKIVLPPSLSAFFSEGGYCESNIFEERKASRLRIRCEARMTIEASPPSIHREELDSVVYIKDISRKGLCILSHFQLLPNEEVFVRFQNREIRAIVVRSRRLGEHCWECGTQITEFTNLEEQA